MSDLYLPPNAIGAYAAAMKAGIPTVDMVRYLKDIGYKHVGMWSDGDNYYVPIPGRLPVICHVSPDKILLVSPTSFALLAIENPGDPEATRAFLDRENAYIPLGGV